MPDSNAQPSHERSHESSFLPCLTPSEFGVMSVGFLESGDWGYADRRTGAPIKNRNRAGEIFPKSAFR